MLEVQEQMFVKPVVAQSPIEALDTGDRLHSVIYLERFNESLWMTSETINGNSQGGLQAANTLLCGSRSLAIPANYAFTRAFLD